MNYDKPHFLQSNAWQQFQQKLGHQVITNSGQGWSYLAIVERAHGIKRLYCPYGPTAGSDTTLSMALDDLKSTAKQHGAVYLRIQPYGLELADKLVSKHQLTAINYSQPNATWTIDLTQSRDELLANMKQNTRNIVRNYQNKGLSYRTSQDAADMPILLNLLHQVARHNQISIHSDDYLITQATSLFSTDSAKLHFIDYQSKTIAAALTYQDDSTVYYAHAAADHEHRKLNASTALVGEILFDAKNHGKSYLDLFGVTTSSDPDHRWAGFTRFKQSFGGQLKTLNQTYELAINPLVYRPYALLRKLRSR